MKTWLFPSFVLVLALAVFVLVFQNIRLERRLAQCQQGLALGTFPRTIEAGSVATPFEAYMPDGSSITIRTDALTAPLILAWLKPDCEPCLDALVGWNDLAGRYAGQFWAISRSDVPADSPLSAARFPILRPRSEKVFGDFQVNATPQTMVIAVGGSIAAVHLGPLDESSMGEILRAAGPPSRKEVK